jgi:hypothetical protein
LKGGILGEDLEVIGHDLIEVLYWHSLGVTKGNRVVVAGALAKI